MYWKKKYSNFLFFHFIRVCKDLSVDLLYAFCVGNSHAIFGSKPFVYETKNIGWVMGVQLSDPTYCKNSNIRGTLAGNNIVDHSYVVGALPVGAAPTTSSFST